MEQKIDSLISQLESNKTAWCKIDIKDIKQAHLYANNKGVDSITFKFDSIDFSVDMITIVLEN